MATARKATPASDENEQPVTIADVDQLLKKISGPPYPIDRARMHQINVWLDFRLTLTNTDGDDGI